MDLEWDCYNLIQLQSRAANLKFNDTFLVVSTYFLTIDMYSLATNEFLVQYMGHTCTITCFNFDQNLMLIISGSADNTIKYWSMQSEGIVEKITTNKLLIKTEPNLIWPVKIYIEEYEDNNNFLAMVLCANGYLFINQINKLEDFVPDMKRVNLNVNPQEKFNFKFKLNISETFKEILSLSEDSLDEFDDQYIGESDSDNFNCGNKSRLTFKDNILTAFIITDNNSSQTKKFFIKKWRLSKNLENDFEFKSFRTDEFKKKSSFLNRRCINLLENRTQFEIISFGYK